jgi:predicted CoA-binding protein
MSKKTLVVGASPNPSRYGYKAVRQLQQHGHPVYAFGIRKGDIGNVQISDEWPEGEFDTITLYLNPQVQKEYYDRMISLDPKRVIFNPGTENPEFWELLRGANIEVDAACTLVMLSVGTY